MEKTLTRQVEMVRTVTSYIVRLAGQTAAIDAHCLQAVMGGPICELGQQARCRVTVEVLSVENRRAKSEE